MLSLLNMSKCYIWKYLKNLPIFHLLYFSEDDWKFMWKFTVSSNMSYEVICRVKVHWEFIIIFFKDWRGKRINRLIEATLYCIMTTVFLSTLVESINFKRPCACSMAVTIIIRKVPKILPLGFFLEKRL